MRDVVFGVNDAILTNLGIVAGFSVALQSNKFIILASLVDIFISAFAMSFGTYMSRTSEQDFLRTKLKKAALDQAADAMGQPIKAAVVMWFTYVAAGFIPIAPFLLGLPIKVALPLAMAAGIGAFFILGALKGALTKTSIVGSAIKFLLFGLVSAAIGLAVGRLANEVVR